MSRVQFHLKTVSSRVCFDILHLCLNNHNHWIAIILSQWSYEIALFVTLQWPCMAKGSSGPSTHSILEKSYTWRWNTILILILKRVDLTAGKVSNSIFRGPPTHPPELTFLNKKWPVEAPKFTNVSQCTDTDLITPKLSCSRPAHMRKLSSDQSFILLSVSYLTEGLSIGGRSDQESSANPFTPLIESLCSSTR